MTSIDSLAPKSVWRFFDAICKIPRPSKHEEKIIAFLMDFAASHNLSAKRDQVGNILITKSATPGFETRRTVVLQSHLDMVCEKNSDTIHDFYTDPIRPMIDGEWVKAQGTTLGADCGIGIATQLAVLAADNLQHGAIECLFTVDEETGLTGAKALQSGFFTGQALINLDSEDEGELFIGCAGGIDTVATISYQLQKAPEGYFALRIAVSGLLGGHSGDDIDKNRGNAIKILNRFLGHLSQNYAFHLQHVEGGNLRNAIAREAFAIVLVPNSKKESVTIDFNLFRSQIENEM
ncbi:MAG: beta-Ala-His dipeptidase, partial [Bacteroidia bacterium]|nr:beta-Ala-His dipeptidase [Bacteroidia bacterium]